MLVIFWFRKHQRVEAGGRPFLFQWICHPHQVQDRDSILCLTGHQEGAVMLSIYLKMVSFKIPVQLGRSSNLRLSVLAFPEFPR